LAGGKRILVGRARCALAPAIPVLARSSVPEWLRWSGGGFGVEIVGLLE